MGNDALSAGSVARRLGVAVTTLRTWHQRYGLGPTQHVKGHHRRYSQEDLARLEVMRRLTAEGVAPAEAAAWARRIPRSPGVSAGDGGAAGIPPTGTGSRRVGGLRRPGGGFTLGVGTAPPAVRGLARAAVRLDSVAMRDIIEQSLRHDGVIATWDTVIRPVLAAIGARYSATAGFVEVEHLLSRCVSDAFARLDRRRGGLHRGGAGVLLACADEEQHTLALEALAAALQEDGVTARLLGARVPPPALSAAIDRTGPAAVVIWSHAADTANPAQLVAARSGRHRPLLLLAAGPGWPLAGLPAEATHVASLVDAVELCRSADATAG
ncbi:MerR family transcriptional regulator [Solwaraspora sp. WMMB335]|uniref:MerR family transcriptional regulator n=1 Tax=Solwaraspora sp. WMMB335 TaxID=3404118 RepID=UPI003B963D95